MSTLPTFIEQGLNPDLFEEITGPAEGQETTYVGYLKNGDTTKAMIKKVEKIGDITTAKFPAGHADFVHDWDQRAALNYAFKR